MEAAEVENWGAFPNQNRGRFGRRGLCPGGPWMGVAILSHRLPTLTKMQIVPYTHTHTHAHAHVNA